MSIIAVGLNHKTAPVAIREQLSFVPDSLQQALKNFSQAADANECAILSTCNRTEIYTNLENEKPLLKWLSTQNKSTPQDLMPYIYVHKETEAIRHILRVASGLDSMVLGEPQILGQMKQAFMDASQAGTIGLELQRLFQYVFSVTKEIRTSTGIGTNPVSIAYSAVNLAKHIFADLSKTTIMVIGAGETIELSLRYLKENNVKDMFIVNRTYSKAQALAEKYFAKAYSFSDISNLLQDVDIVICATSSSIPVIGKGTVERALKLRKHRSMFFVDLAVPRDIEPEVGDLQDVYLYCVDDLQQIIQNNLKNRSDAALEAEQIIELQVDHYMRWLKSLNVVETIRNFRAKIEGIRDSEIKNAMQELQAGQKSAEAVICSMARNLTNKFMHIPTVQLRQAGYEQDLDTVALARQLFELED